MDKPNIGAMASQITQSLFRLTLILAVSLLLVVGCSRVKLGYHFADVFLAEYASDYLELDGDQTNAWIPQLRESLGEHRREELPYLAAFFDQFERAVEQGLTPAAMTCLLDDTEVIYRRHIRLAAEAAAPLLADLDAGQINALARTFDEEAAEDAVEETPEEDAKGSAERFADNLKFWLGELDQPQKNIIARFMPELPESRSFYDYRDAQRRALIDLLRAGAPAPHIQGFLIDWLVDFQNAPAQLEQDRQRYRRVLTELLVALDPTFSDQQRQHLLQRLGQLREDFLSLQPTPRLANSHCQGSDDQTVNSNGRSND